MNHERIYKRLEKAQECKYIKGSTLEKSHLLNPSSLHLMVRQYVQSWKHPYWIEVIRFQLGCSLKNTLKDPKESETGSLLLM